MQYRLCSASLFCDIVKSNLIYMYLILVILYDVDQMSRIYRHYLEN